ncbi:hypothetical protein N7449_011281 [Penicillium cf. viridicatum]|uniref:Aminoglycoside phosphotransferase domain-containing protein n=1 Tax=Penicillium cf. viridicatum TaxID=2972119 RepID=A0A9W9M416_9EURO|nr:hypothetical protein N7449_011281 [Penicillium cf. viridicatum]
MSKNLVSPYGPPGVEMHSSETDSVGASKCISIEKYPDDMFNKAFLMTMDNGREVVSKVPNPNAGVPHFTTASEVATMDFKKWLSVSFSHYGSLYYTGDVQQHSNSSHFLKDGNTVESRGFTIGPSTARDWLDGGRSKLDINRGSWASPTDYLRAVGTREQKAVQCLKPAKQLALFCGPKLYQPDMGKKLDALAYYQRVLWHDDLHDDNIFVDPENPENITGVIDWQSCHISPLFNHNPDPAFLDWDGLEPETLDLIPRPILSELSPEDRATAMHEYTVQNVFIGWRKLMQSKNPALYRVTEFRKTAAYGLIFLAHRMFEYGETHFQSLLVDIKDSWASLPAVTSNAPFPFDFSEADIERIKRDGDAAVAGTDLVSEAKGSLGDLWPDKGFIEQKRYDDCKAALGELKGQILEQLSETDEERAEYERYWPFD